MPNDIAKELVGVQPMTANMINPSTNWEKVGKDMSTDKWVYHIKIYEAVKWIESQPIHMWKHYDIPFDQIRNTSLLRSRPNYIFTDEMESWFLLRWS